MWQYETLNPDELMHYGVLGMKWGKRKARYTSDLDIAKSNYKIAKKAYKRSEINSKSLSTAKQTYKREKEKNKTAIGKNQDKMRLMDLRKGNTKYSRSTYKKAAKNMVNKGMDQKTALSKAKVDAWRNTGIAVASAFAYANRDKIASSVKKYANAKARQRANAGLARIGTMKLTKVAGNVYEYKMR